MTTEYIAGSAEAEVERMRTVLDENLGPIFTAFAELIPETYGRSGDELTPRDVAIRSGYSAVHRIAKEIATGVGKDLYDLPSVLDLMKTLRKERQESGLARGWDEGFAASDHYQFSGGRKPTNPYTRKMRGEE